MSCNQHPQDQYNQIESVYQRQNPAQQFGQINQQPIYTQKPLEQQQEENIEKPDPNIHELSKTPTNANLDEWKRVENPPAQVIHQTQVHQNIKEYITQQPGSVNTQYQYIQPQQQLYTLQPATNYVESVQESMYLQQPQQPVILQSVQESGYQQYIVQNQENSLQRQSQIETASCNEKKITEHEPVKDQQLNDFINQSTRDMEQTPNQNGQQQQQQTQQQFVQYVSSTPGQSFYIPQQQQQQQQQVYELVETTPQYQVVQQQPLQGTQYVQGTQYIQSTQASSIKKPIDNQNLVTPKTIHIQSEAKEEAKQEIPEEQSQQGERVQNQIVYQEVPQQAQQVYQVIPNQYVNDVQPVSQVVYQQPSSQLYEIRPSFVQSQVVYQPQPVQLQQQNQSEQQKQQDEEQSIQSQQQPVFQQSVLQQSQPIQLVQQSQYPQYVLQPSVIPTSQVVLQPAQMVESRTTKVYEEEKPKSWFQEIFQ